ncbi:MAG: hypothetical protein SFU98_22525 [Leptospiraceae bacterium]|nr:hypothetical protein [Leptospiraceae bacterium]
MGYQYNITEEFGIKLSGTFLDVIHRIQESTVKSEITPLVYSLGYFRLDYFYSYLARMLPVYDLQSSTEKRTQLNIELIYNF